MKEWKTPTVEELAVLETKSGVDLNVKEKKQGAKPDNGPGGNGNTDTSGDI